jgi:hypothetical protein
MYMVWSIPGALLTKRGIDQPSGLSVNGGTHER